MLNIFEDDAFSVVNMSTAIQELPTKPTKLSDMGLFKVTPVTTRTIPMEFEGGRIYLITTTNPGVTTRVAATGRRSGLAVTVPHLALDAEVLAEDVAGLRQFGQAEALEMASAVVERKLQILKDSHEATKEWHRAGSIKGIILEPDGSTEILDLFTLFGVTEESIGFDFADGADIIKLLALDVIEHVEENINGQSYDHVHALVGRTAWRNMLANTEIADAFRDLDDNEYARTNRIGRTQMEFGDIVWEPYRDKVGARNFIADTEIRFFPVGAPDLFEQFNAPANFMETVNTPGEEYYAKQEPKKYNMGIDIHSQSNPLFMCNRPAVLVKGVDTTGA